MRQPQTNKYKVPNKEWTKWLPEAQELFNQLYQTLGDTDVFMGGAATKELKPYLDTARWNAAFLAASDITLILKDGASERLMKVVSRHGKVSRSAQ